MKFAPLNIPMERRLQTLAVAITTSLFFIFFTVFLLCVFNPISYPFLIIYLFWTTFDNAHERGGRRWEYVRNLRLWTFLRDYFPCKLVKQVDLDPSKNYVFGYHPHGIISTGLWISMCTNACGTQDLFPGLTIHPLTLTQNFRIPFWRDFLLWAGLCSVSRKSCDLLLTRAKGITPIPKDPCFLLRQRLGSSIVLVPGGAREALDSHPGTSQLTLRKRRGFVKVALTHGASLVPIFAFGENEIFLQVDNSEGTLVRKWQQLFLKYVGIAPCMPYGRGMFQYDFGFLPKRHPITLVFGRPIECPKVGCAGITDDLVEKYHGFYCDELTAIYDEFKDKYSPSRKEDLKIVR